MNTSHNDNDNEWHHHHHHLRQNGGARDTTLCLEPQIRFVYVFTIILTLFKRYYYYYNNNNNLDYNGATTNINLPPSLLPTTATSIKTPGNDAHEKDITLTAEKGREWGWGHKGPKRRNLVSSFMPQVRSLYSFFFVSTKANNYSIYS